MSAQRILFVTQTDTGRAKLSAHLTLGVTPRASWSAVTPRNRTLVGPPRICVATGARNDKRRNAVEKNPCRR